MEWGHVVVQSIEHHTPDWIPEYATIAEELKALHASEWPKVDGDRGFA
jgi:hypothetical protein